MLFLGSCGYFNQPKEEHLSKQDTVIDFHSIDTYPLFPNCTELLSKEEQEQCFYAEISQQITHLLRPSFKVKTNLNDTVLLQLKVDNQGFIIIKNIQQNNHIQQNIPQLDSIIKTQLKQLKKVEPATKRGIPVTTEFTLPIVVSTKK